MISFLAEILHLALMVMAALILGGDRGGMPSMAMFRGNLTAWRGLWRQEPIWPEPQTRVFWLAPALSLAASLIAAALTPSFTTALPGAPLATMPLLLGLLGLSALAPGLALLEGGTMASGLMLGQVLAFAVLAAPALFLTLWTEAQLAGSVLVGGISIEIAQSAPVVPRLLGLLALAALIHAAPAPLCAPDHAGRARAALRAAAALRRVVSCSLVVDLFFPLGISPLGITESGPRDWGIGILAWAIKTGAVALAWKALSPARQTGALALAGPAMGASFVLALLAALFAALGRGAA